MLQQGGWRAAAGRTVSLAIPAGAAAGAGDLARLCLEGLPRTCAGAVVLGHVACADADVRFHAHLRPEAWADQSA